MQKLFNDEQLNPFIYALDFDNFDEAKKMVKTLAPVAGCFKIGLGLLPLCGYDWIKHLTQEGHKIFLDVKLFDTADTIYRAVRRLLELNVHFLTLQGDAPIIESAVKAQQDHNNFYNTLSPTHLLSITVLTSYDSNILKKTGYDKDIIELSKLKAEQNLLLNGGGVVTSSSEGLKIRQHLEAFKPNYSKFNIIFPGIRTLNDLSHDQKRITLPEYVFKLGGTHMVIGRSITREKDPLKKAIQIIEKVYR